MRECAQARERAREMQIRTIMVPTDFSESAAQAFESALGLAKTFGAHIYLLHAYQLPVQLGVGEPVPLPQDFFDQLRKRAQQHVDEWIEKARAAGVEATGDVIQAIPGHAIAEVAERKNIDLIVMGTRGLTGLKHVVLGSVAERTVRLAHCPVMTVRLHDKEGS